MPIAEETHIPRSAAPVLPPVSDHLTHSSVRAAYRRMAPVYDWMFNACFRDGRHKVVERLCRHGARNVLEAGVGTGLSLHAWPKHVRVTGIDLSPEMLARAERLRHRAGLHHVNLRVMDAQATDFATDSFDGIAVMYVVSVVPDLWALLRELRRVCRPGGRICIVNHFAHQHPVFRRVEQAASAWAGTLGFNAALPLESVTRAEGLRIVDLQRVNWGGYWSLIEAENIK
jgi:phosphatidylethanolamine/phosphatidyl-N-methylethanolamine N-methyltransferase